MVAEMMKTPRKRASRYDTLVVGKALYLMKQAGLDWAGWWKKGWKVYATNTVRGRCDYQNLNVTIPTWVIEGRRGARRPLYIEWYVAHELAHTFCPGAKHGPEFMAMLKRLCPPEALVYETEYKPRRAKAAGIRRPVDPSIRLQSIFNQLSK